MLEYCRDVKFLPFILAFLLMTCSREPVLENFPDNEEDLSKEILLAIQASDVQKLCALQVPPEISAKYGFYDYVRPEEMMTLVKSPDEFIQLSLQRAEEVKPIKLAEIKSFLERTQLEYDWQDAKIESVKLGDSNEEAQATNLLTKKKKTYKIHKLEVRVSLRNKKQVIISTPFATQFDGKWLLYATGSAGVSVRESR